MYNDIFLIVYRYWVSIHWSLRKFLHFSSCFKATWKEASKSSYSRLWLRETSTTFPRTNKSDGTNRKTSRLPPSLVSLQKLVLYRDLRLCREYWNKLAVEIHEPAHVWEAVEWNGVSRFPECFEFLENPCFSFLFSLCFYVIIRAMIPYQSGKRCGFYSSGVFSKEIFTAE